MVDDRWSVAFNLNLVGGGWVVVVTGGQFFHSRWSVVFEIGGLLFSGKWSVVSGSWPVVGATLVGGWSEVLHYAVLTQYEIYKYISVL